mmetsp:Transcript_86345/g.172779  ORF Transcript_86345/g.172779 Transcript_86345/m.172779 type:complete len:293 (+) Transcript_86345:568-1446(+)
MSTAAGSKVPVCEKVFAKLSTMTAAFSSGVEQRSGAPPLDWSFRKFRGDSFVAVLGPRCNARIATHESRGVTGRASPSADLPLICSTMHSIQLSLALSTARRTSFRAILSSVFASSVGVALYALVAALRTLITSSIASFACMNHPGRRRPSVISTCFAAVTIAASSTARDVLTSPSWLRAPRSVEMFSVTASLHSLAFAGSRSTARSTRCSFGARGAANVLATSMRMRSARWSLSTPNAQVPALRTRFRSLCFMKKWSSWCGVLRAGLYHVSWEYLCPPRGVRQKNVVGEQS